MSLLLCAFVCVCILVVCWFRVCFVVYGCLSFGLARLSVCLSVWLFARGCFFRCGFCVYAYFSMSCANSRPCVQKLLIVQQIRRSVSANSGRGPGPQHVDVQVQMVKSKRKLLHAWWLDRIDCWKLELRLLCVWHHISDAWLCSCV